MWWQAWQVGCTAPGSQQVRGSKSYPFAQCGISRHPDMAWPPVAVCSCKGNARLLYGKYKVTWLVQEGSRMVEGDALTAAAAAVLQTASLYRHHPRQPPVLRAPVWPADTTGGLCPHLNHPGGNAHPSRLCTHAACSHIHPLGQHGS